MQMLNSGWSAAPAAPDAGAGAEALAGLPWEAADVPGSVGMLHAAHADLETVDWWFQTEFDAEAAGPGEEVALHVGGIATVADVYLNGELVLQSESMFAVHEVDVGRRLRGRNHLAIRCRALAPLVAQPRTPRARWRSRLVEDGGIRWFRTMLLGRMPGTAPGPALVGPWRPIWLERRRGAFVDDLRVRAHLDGDDGVLVVRAVVRGIGEDPPSELRLQVDGPSGTHSIPMLAIAGEAQLSYGGELRIPSVERWWPHTHGKPALHDVRLLARSRQATETVIAASRIGFRTIAPGPTPDHDLEREGLDLHVNGVPIFCRGAVWAVGDEARSDISGLAYRAMLESVSPGRMT